MSEEEDEKKLEERLKSEIVDLLKEVEHPYKKIYNFLKLHFEDQCHDIKGRIKSHAKFVEKVLKKKREEREDYSITDVEDVLGFRVIVLAKREIPSTFSKLLEVLEIEDRIGSTSFEIRIKEIVYYPGAIADKELPASLRQIVEKSELDTDIFEVDDTKKSGYSSLHIILYCKTDKGPTFKEVPLELQIRTAFEDVWGEIEHRVKYKVDLDKLNELSEVQRKSVETLKSLFVQLKQQVDVADGLANKITSEIDDIFEVADTLSTSVSDEVPTRNLSSQLKKLKAPELDEMYTTGIRVRDDALELSRQGAEWNEIARTLESAETHIDGLLSAVRKLVVKTKPSIKLKDKVELSVRQELAYIEFLQAEQARQLMGPDFARRLYDKALASFLYIVKQMEASEEDRSPTVPYRIAQIQFNRQELLEADEMSDLAQTWLQDSEVHQKDQKHWMHTTLPRFKGLIIWSITKSAWDGAKKFGKDVREHEFQSFYEAFQVTRAVLDNEVSVRRSDGEKENDTEAQKQRTLNNLVCYLTDLYDARGTDGKLAKALAPDAPFDLLADYLRQMNYASIEALGEISSASRAETACRGYYYLNRYGDDANGSEFSQKSELLIHSTLRLVHLLSLQFLEDYKEKYESLDLGSASAAITSLNALAEKGELSRMDRSSVEMASRAFDFIIDKR